MSLGKYYRNILTKRDVSCRGKLKWMNNLIEIGQSSSHVQMSGDGKLFLVLVWYEVKIRG